MRTKQGSYPAPAPAQAARLKEDAPKPTGRPSSLVDTRVIYCGDNLEQLKKLPDACVDLIYIDPPFNSNRNYEVFWGETKEKRSFEDRHESTQAYIDYMRPRCVELARVLKKTGSFYYHCDWHASHYVKVMLDGIFGENNFQNEIVWKRTCAHATQVARHYGDCMTAIFFYTGGDGLHLESAIRAVHEEIHRSNITATKTPTAGAADRDDLRRPGAAPEAVMPLRVATAIRRRIRTAGHATRTMEELDAEGRLISNKAGRDRD